MFGKRNDNQMAESEAIEWGIENAYVDNQTKRFLFEQLQDEQRQRNLAAYDAEQQRHAQNYQAMESERRARAAQVRANGGKWIALPGNRYIDADGNIVYASDLC